MERDDETNANACKHEENETRHAADRRDNEYNASMPDKYTYSIERRCFLDARPQHRYTLEMTSYVHSARHAHR